MKVLLIGAGGHGQVVADIIRARHASGVEMECVGYLDDDPELEGTTVLGHPVLGGLRRYPQIPHDAVCVAIGANAVRRDVFLRLEREGERSLLLLHPAATIGTDVTMGPGTMVCAGVVVNVAARVGRNSILNTSSAIDHHCVIGDHVHIGPGARLGGRVHVGDGAFVGIGSVVLPGVNIGPNATIGGGAVVLKDVPAGITVVGNPARPLGL